MTAHLLLAVQSICDQGQEGARKGQHLLVITCAAGSHDKLLEKKPHHAHYAARHQAHAGGATKPRSGSAFDMPRTIVFAKLETGLFLRGETSPRGRLAAERLVLPILEPHSEPCVLL